MSQFSEKIIDATKKFEDRDKEISEIYRWFEGDKMDLFKDIRDASNEIGESIHDATDAIKKKLKKMPKSQWRKHVYLL